MALLREVKIELVRRYTPLLYHDLDEPDLPVDPHAYAAESALWSSVPPEHAKTSWGLPSGDDRVPLIKRGSIEPEPGSFPPETEPGTDQWLDAGGWVDGPDVTPASENRRARGLPPGHLPQPWYSADVWTINDLVETRGVDYVISRFGLDTHAIPDSLAGIVVVAYQFLYPLHRQPRRTTEHPADRDPWTNDYEGDWTCFAVICRGDDVPDAQVTAECVPMLAAFGERWRLTGPDHLEHTAEGMVLRPWTQLLTADGHPVVVASPGTHNLHPHDPPLGPDGSIRPTTWDGGQLSQPLSSWVQDKVESPEGRALSAITLAKALTGLGLAGVPGLVVGLVAASAEAEEFFGGGHDEPPDLETDPAPGDDPLLDDWVDLEKEKIGAPEGLAVQPPLIDPAQSEVRHWLPRPEEALVDDSVLLSPYLRANGQAFTGRWGVRCEADPLVVRGGIRLPDYRGQVVDALLRSAS